MQFTFTFEGNLGSAPEVRFTPSGVAVAKMSVGHNTRRRNAAATSSGTTCVSGEKMSTADSGV